MNTRYDKDSHGIRAPRFRPQCKRPYPKKGEKYPLSGVLISNDAQIIDMHWLYCCGRRSADESTTCGVFDGDEFNYSKAEEFVKKKGHTHKKAVYIGLDLDEQWQMSIIGDNTVRDGWKRLKVHALKIVKNLRALGKRNPNVRGNEDVWADVAMAEKIEQQTLSSEETVSYVRVARWYSLMTGTPMDRQTARRKLTAVHRHIDLEM